MQLAEEFRYLVLAAQREGNRILTEALRPLDLTPSQAEVLRVLQEHQPLSLIALGELLVCESGSPSRLVNGLVEADLVKRVPSATNGRMVTLTLTAKGEEMATRVGAVEAALYEFITKALEGQSFSEGIALLWRLVEGRPAGEALARRIRRVHEGSEAS
ncbi:MAG: winged helix DNA-binding protein [Chloroflexi bacterium]|nr:MAG: winged helix DNA-binding protein [Chloroflexota bacterium]